MPIMDGRYRAHGSQHGNALLAVIRLGLVDDRAPRLVERLLHWQWPDGGWNCDRDPTADTSSFMETLPPMRALAACLICTGDVEAGRAADRAVEVFLERHLFKRRSTGRVIHREFTKLHYPLYWHYDVLAGLRAMAELGRIGYPRCDDALICSSRSACPTAAGRPRLGSTSTRRHSHSATTTSTGAARARAAQTRG